VRTCRALHSGGRSSKGRPSKALLQGADFTGAELRGASLTNAKLQGATLEGANLQGTSLSGADMQGVELDRADLRGAYLSEAKLWGASLQDAPLQGASLKSAQVWRANGSVFQEPSLHRATDLIDLAGIDPSTNPWTSLDPAAARNDFFMWRDQALEDVPAGQLRDDATKRLSVLEPVPEAAPKAAIGAEDWKTIASEQLPGEERSKALGRFLANLACSGDAAPYVARGLVENRGLDPDYDSALLGILAGRLREGRSNQVACPGVKGFNDADWAYLDGIAGPAPNPPAKKPAD
jgi:hypothetical protein